MFRSATGQWPVGWSPSREARGVGGAERGWEARRGSRGGGGRALSAHLHLLVAEVRVGVVATERLRVLADVAVLRRRLRRGHQLMYLALAVRRGHLRLLQRAGHRIITSDSCNGQASSAPSQHSN